MTRKFSFLCLTEKVEYSFLKADELVEGQRGFTWCISLSERKDHHAIDFILTTIKTQVLMATGDDFSPSRIVIDFDQGTFPLSLSKYSPKIKLASVLAIEEVLPKTEIEYCYVHLYRAVKDKAMELFQGIDLENCTSRDFVEAVVMIEFRDFWLSTTSLLDLDHNLQVNSNLTKYFQN